MGYDHLFAERDLALLHDWLQQTGELYVDLDRPHSGASNNSAHFVQSLEGLRTIVSRETWPEISIEIFREKQYPIRGTVDDALLAAALEYIPDHQWFSIVSPGNDPLAPFDVIGSGDSHDELREEWVRLKSRNIRLGQNPFDLQDSFFESPDDVWVARYYRHPEPHVLKNRTAYAPFDTDPDQYGPHIVSW
jgi:hypothetical protein